MTLKEFFNVLSTVEISNDKIERIQSEYGAVLPTPLRQIISYSDDTVFFDDERRLLSFSEIANAAEELHVDFKKNKIIPLFDCLDNDFIVYNFDKNTWSFYNIVDKVSFEEVSAITDLL